tara:strand:- start:808 stop:915 length:108 start_codon:yes stop_codon:yes gene_type:complete
MRCAFPSAGTTKKKTPHAFLAAGFSFINFSLPDNK